MNELTGTDPEQSRQQLFTEDQGPKVLSFPWITYGIIGLCCAVFAYLNLGDEDSHYDMILGLLWLHPIEIWSGAVWALLTTALIHGDPLHLIFNMWWTRDFGSLLEPTMGRARYLLFIVTAAAVSSGVELAVSSSTGIGFSGVVYAMFGYALAARTAVPVYREMTDRSTTMWLIGWMVYCIVMTHLEIMNAGNAAHVSGFIFGFCFANLRVVKISVNLSRIAVGILLVITILSVSYMPWSPDWSDRKEITAWWDLVEAAEAGDANSQYQYGNSMIWDDESKAEGVEWLRKSAEQNHTAAMNDLAWLLATDPNSAFRNGKEAVKWGLKACQNEKWADSTTIDTLAAAYAELEQWDDAVKMQELALSKLAGTDKELKADHESRLALYRQREKFREATGEEE